MTDLVERLRRRIIVDGMEMPGNDALHREAADEIERLREQSANHVGDKVTAIEDRDKLADEIERLRAALESIASPRNANPRAAFEMYEIAREALRNES